MSILLTAILESMFLIHPGKCITEKTIISKETTISIIRILKLQESRNSKTTQRTFVFFWPWTWNAAQIFFQQRMEMSVGITTQEAFAPI